MQGGKILRNQAAEKMKLALGSSKAEDTTVSAQTAADCPTIFVRGVSRVNYLTYFMPASPTK